MKTDRPYQLQHPRWLKNIGWIIVTSWFSAALVVPLEGQASARQNVTVTAAANGAYTVRGDQNKVAVKILTTGVQLTYRSPAGLDLLALIPFDGCLHLEQLEAQVRLLNTGATVERVTVLGRNIELTTGARIAITGDPTQATVSNATSAADSAAWAASDTYLNALAEKKLFGLADKEAARRLETTYQTAFADALQQQRSAQEAAQRAQQQIARLDLSQAIAQAADLLADTLRPQIIAAAENMLQQTAMVQVDGQALAIGQTASMRAPVAAEQRTTLEPGQRGVVRVDTGFRPAVNGFRFANYGGEYPHGDLTTEDARLLFGDQACAGANTAGCLTSPAAYVWVSRMNRVLKYGHCEGMAVLSALLFTGQEQPPQYGGQIAAELRPSKPALIRAIGRYSAMQMLTPVWDEAASFRAKTPAEILAILTSALPQKQFYTMGLYSATAAQTVLPYAIEDMGNGNVWVHVYDPNYPQEGKYVEIDPAANRWRYDGVEGGAGTIDLTAVATRQQTMSSPFTPALSATLLLIDSQTADLAITASDGKTMLIADGQMMNQIPGAAIMRLRGKEKLLPGERGASLGQPEGAGLPVFVSLPAGAEYLLTMSVPGDLTAEELTMTPDALKSKEKLLFDERGKEKLLLEEERGKEKLLLEEERGKEKLVTEEERGKEKLLLEEERGKEKLLLEEERGKEKLLLEEERGKEKLLLEEERGKEKLLLEEERGAVGETPTNSIWLVVFQPNQAYLVDRITLKPGTTEQLLLARDGAVQYHAGTNQQLTVVAGSAVAGRANARYTIKKIALHSGYDFTIGQQPATGQTWFRTNDPAIAALDATIRIEDGQTSQRYAYPTLAAPLTGQHVVELQADGRFRIGVDANLDGRPEELLADANVDGIPDGFAAEDANMGVIPGAQGKLVADTGFRPNQHGFSFENYAQNQYPYGDLTIDDAWRMFGDQVCETVNDGVCQPAAAAQLWVTKMNQAMQRGHCEGMAVLSAWLYTGEATVAGFRGNQAYNLDTSNEALLRKIAYYWTSQTLEPVKSSYLAFRAKTPTQILQTLITAMNAKSETYTIGIYGRGGHAVTPYAVEDLGQGVFWVHVYDNNYPGVGKYIEINTNTDTWKYAGAAVNPAEDASPWEGGTGTIDLTPSAVRQQPLTCPFCKSPDKSAPRTITIMVDGDGVQLSAKTADGKQIRMERGQVLNQIPGAQMTSLRSGRPEADEDLASDDLATLFGGDRATMLTLPAGKEYALALTGDGSGQGSAWMGIMMPGVMIAIDDLALDAGFMDLLTLLNDGLLEYLPGQVQRPTVAVATNTPGKPDGTYTISGGNVDENSKLSVQVNAETGDITIAYSDVGFPEVPVSETAGSETPEITMEPARNAPPVADDAQTLVEDLQRTTAGIASGSAPGTTEDPTEIDLPGPGEDGNNEPRRIRIPVTIIP